MIVTDEQPVNGHTVNGHGHRWAGFQPITPTVVGPAEPLTQPVPATAGPGSELDTRAAPGPEPGPAESGVTKHQRPAPDAPELPPAPDKPSEDEHEVRFPLRRAKDVGFAMSVALAAIGQILFFRETFVGWFGHPFASTVAAVAVAACFEVGMVGAGDEGLRQRARDVENWRLLLATSAFIAVVAVTVQTLHWLPNIGFAVTFGFASLVGWVIHVVTGWVRANSYRQAMKDYRAKLAERESYERALRERHFAAWESQQQATTRAAATVAPGPASGPAQPVKAKQPASKGKATGKGTSKGTGKSVRSISKAEALAFFRAQPGADNAAFRRHCAELGYTSPHQSSISRYRNEAKDNN